MRCTKCGRVLRSDESRCPLCGTPAASPKSASDPSSKRQTIRIAARKKNTASTKSGSSPVLDEVLSALSISFRDSHDSAPAEPPAETHTVKTRIIPVKRSKAEPVPPAPVSEAPEEPAEESAASNDLSSSLLAAVDSILSGHSIPTEPPEAAAESVEKPVPDEDELDEVILPDEPVEEPVPEADEEEPDEVILPDEPVEEPVPETAEEEPDEVVLPDKPVEEPVPETAEEKPDEVVLPDEPAEEPVPEWNESEAAAESPEEPEIVPVFKTPEELADAITAISASVAARISNPEESEEPDEPVDALPDACAEIEGAAEAESAAAPEESDTADDTSDPVDALPDACAEIEDAAEAESAAAPEESDTADDTSDPVDALLDACAEIEGAAEAESAVAPEESDTADDTSDPVDALLDACAEIEDAAEAGENPSGDDVSDSRPLPSDSAESQEEDQFRQSLADALNAPRVDTAHTVPKKNLEHSDLSRSIAEALADLSVLSAPVPAEAEAPNDALAEEEVWDEEPAAAIPPSESSAPAEETEEPVNVPEAEPQDDETDDGVELPTENDGLYAAEEAAPVPEPVFLEPDPELDALTDSITAAVAAAINISVIPHEGAVSTTSDSVSDDTDPLDLPEEVKAMLPDAEPPAPQEPTSLEQTTEEDSMKPVAKKIRKPVRFRFVYIIPALILSVLFLAGAILFAINSLLTPIEMPEKPAEQQASDTAKNTDTTSTDDSAASIGGLYFDL